VVFLLIGRFVFNSFIHLSTSFARYKVGKKGGQQQALKDLADANAIEEKLSKLKEKIHAEKVEKE